MNAWSNPVVDGRLWRVEMADQTAGCNNRWDGLTASGKVVESNSRPRAA